MASGQKKKHVVSYIMTALAAAAIAGAVIGYEMSLRDETELAMTRILCDGFFISGVFILSFGILMTIASAGGFHGFRYLGHVLVTLFTPSKSRFERRKSYSEFLQEAENKEKGGNRPLLIIGGICILVSVLFLVLFEKNY